MSSRQTRSRRGAQLGYASSNLSDGLPPELQQSLRRHLQQLPPVRPSGREETQLEALVSKSLNVSPAYATHFNSGIRELIQNWHDQCKVVGGSKAISVVDLSPAGVAVPARRDVLLACNAADGLGCCGYLALFGGSVAEGTCTVHLCNYAATMRISAMTLGETSKRGNQQGLAGFFGEGVKVEINRIVATGASVHYLTSNQRWDFAYEQEHGSQVLYLHSTRLGSAASGDTLVAVQRAQRAWFKPNNFLFLSPRGYQRFSSPILEVLPEPEHAGRVYAHGIFVAASTEMPLMGLNYRGAGDTLELVGIGRDRNSVQASSLVLKVPQVFTALAGKPAECADLADRLCAVLSSHPYSVWRSVAYCARWGEGKFMADCLYEAFWRKHSESHIPATASSPNDAAYLGFETVKVSQPLYDVLKESRHHPTSDDLWERRYQQLLSIPDHQWRQHDAADRYRASLVNSLLASLAKYLSPANLKVKALPAGNKDIILALQRKSPARAGGVNREPPLFILDLTALVPAAVHARFKLEDSAFTCNLKSCTCLPIALEDAAIAAIAKAHSISPLRLRRELRQAQHQRQGLGWRGDMSSASEQGPCWPTAAASEPEPEPEAVPEAKPEPEPEPEAVHIPPQGTTQDADPVPDPVPEQPRPGSSSAGPAAGHPRRSARCAKRGCPGCTTQQEGAAGGSAAAAGSADGQPPEPMVGVLSEADLDDGVRGSLHPDVGPQGRDILLRAQAASVPLGPVLPEVPPADCRISSGHLAKTRFLVGGGDPLYLPQGIPLSTITPQQRDSFRSLWALLNRLHSQVFLRGTAQRSVFYLYFDPQDGIVAFNLAPAGGAGEIWYNAAYDVAEVQARATHWFLTACHELAHNFVRAHNSEFAQVNSQIVLRYALRYRQLFPGAFVGGQDVWYRSAAQMEVDTGEEGGAAAAPVPAPVQREQPTLATAAASGSAAAPARAQPKTRAKGKAAAPIAKGNTYGLRKQATKRTGK